MSSINQLWNEYTKDVREYNSPKSRSMNIDNAVEIALQEPTLDDALVYICIWENERSIEQALKRHGSGSNGAGWDTCFGVCIKRVMSEYQPNINEPK